MRIAFRWLGPTDPVSLEHIAQIPGVESAVAALYDVAPGKTWPPDAVRELADRIRAVGLDLDIIESLPVHEDIKLGRPSRDGLIETYRANLRCLADAGVSLVVYNFMPLFDWYRTDLAKVLADGSSTMAFSEADLHENADPWSEEWAAYFPLDESPAELMKAYRGLDESALRDCLAYFLEAVVPTAEDAGIALGIHPDDPPWSIFGIPRVVKDRSDLRFIVDAVDSRANGLALCVGSLGANPTNDLVGLVHEFAERIHFVHARNVKHSGYRQFYETAHPPASGDVDLVAVLQALRDVGFRGWIRPDHGRMIWGETGTPGYGLYDRALGAAFLNGVWHGLARDGAAR